MSHNISNNVWKKSKAKGSKLLLLLAMADNADDYGFCWPSIKHLAKKTRMSERQTMRNIRDLELMGEVVASKKRNSGNIYVIVSGLTEHEISEYIEYNTNPPRSRTRKITPNDISDMLSRSKEVIQEIHELDEKEIDNMSYNVTRCHLISDILSKISDTSSSHESSVTCNESPYNLHMKQNSNVSDNLNLEPSPDGDSFLLSIPDGDINYEIDNQPPQKQPATTEATTMPVVDDFSDWEPTAEERKPREHRTAADVRRETAASVAKYIERGDSEPWREWFPGTVKDVNGIPAYELQKVGHTLCSVTGWQPDPRMVRAWLPELARLYDLAGGKVKYIQSATEEVWQREPQYRPKSPHGLAQPVMDYRARSKPPSPDEQRKLWNLGGR